MKNCFSISFIKKIEIVYYKIYFDRKIGISTKNRKYINK